MKNNQVEATNNKRDTARVEAFSDGVFAIAITLLILDVHVPDLKPHENLWLVLGNQWPMFLGYITSFIVLGIVWLNHHHMFTYINRTDRVMLILNTLGLMFVAFIPFPTALVAKYIETENARVAVIIYSGTLLIMTILYNLLWWYAITDFRLVRKDTDPYIHQAILRSYMLGVPLYALSIVLAFVNVEASLILYILIAILYTIFAGSFPSVKPSSIFPRLRSNYPSKD